MKATIALFFLGLCTAVPLYQRQEDPDDSDATFTITASMGQLRFRQNLPPGYETSGTYNCIFSHPTQQFVHQLTRFLRIGAQQPPFPTNTSQPGSGGGPGFGPTGGLTAGPQEPESTSPTPGGQRECYYCYWPSWC
ncbi:hypothetical protein F5B21DRAFT_475784 [Xylaria acuta]|nr:hypothetical protein F5B21DRAFT_475784 [Xylaria acuta]